MRWVGIHGSLLRQHSQCRDQRHLALLTWKVLDPLGLAALAGARREVASRAGYHHTVESLQRCGRLRRGVRQIDRLLFVVAIAVLLGSLQGDAISLDGLRSQVDFHPTEEPRALCS